MKVEPVLVLFAKKPIEGEVKTRLSPPLNLSQANQVAMILIQQSIDTACRFWPGKVELCLWPDVESDFIQKLRQIYDFDLSAQSKGDLGDKMYVSMADKTILNQVGLIMGCDVLCSRGIFVAAFDALKQNQNIIGPTIDGGYYCIAVNQPHRGMFANVDWGTQKAFEQTLISCKNAQIEFDLKLPQLRDLDTYEDLVVLSQQYSALQEFLI